MFKRLKNKLSSKEEEGTFGYLNNLIHGDNKNIVLNSDIILDEKLTNLRFVLGIYLDVDDLVIDGNGHVIDAKELIRHFYVKAKNVTLKNLTLKNGYFSKGFGGSIFIEKGCKLNLINVKFFNNKSNTEGGAIINFGQLSIKDCFFEDNFANSDGGSIHNEKDSVLIIENSTFNNNETLKNGGAIINFGELTVEDSNFENNKSTGQGGAIFNSGIGTLKITKSEFNNDVGLNGGAIQNFGNITVYGSKFNRNNSKKDGGAINNQKTANLKINNTKFYENDSELAGGAIINWGNLILNDSKFKNNRAKINGNDIYNQQTLQIINSQFNLPQDEAIYSNSQIILENNQFKEKDIGVTFDEISTSERRNFKYLDKLVNSGTKEIILDSDIILDNGEDSIYPDGIIIQSNNLIIDGNGYEIDACGKTQIFFNASENVILKNITLKNGYANNKPGGAIFQNPNCSLKIINSSFIDNRADTEGGAIINFGTLEIKDSIFENNTSKSWGGAVMNLRDIVFDKVLFKNNNSKEVGWDIANRASLKICNSQFNHIKDYAIFSTISDITIENTEFSKKDYNILLNELSKYKKGNFRYLDNLINCGAKKIILDSDIIIDENEEAFYQYGIEIREDNIIIDGAGHTIDAKKKIPIFTINGQNVTIKNFTLKNGFSRGFGGAIGTNVGYNNLKIINTNFIDNESEARGGALSLVVNTEITNSTFTNNVTDKPRRLANSMGDDIYSESILKIKESVFETYTHRSIYSKSTNPLEIENCEFINEEGQQEFEKLQKSDKRNFKYLDDLIKLGLQEIVLDSDIIYEEGEEERIEINANNIIIDGNGYSIDGKNNGINLCINGNNITFKNITFKNANILKKLEEGKMVPKYHAVLDVYKDYKLNLINTNFINNESLWGNGAIYIGNSKSFIYIKDSFFINNSGAIENNGKLKIINTEFLDNCSKENGGVIKNIGGTVDISKSKFTNNQAEYGGVIHNQRQGDLKIQSSVFENNVGIEDAVIYNKMGSIKLIDSKFNKHDVTNNIIHNEDTVEVLGLRFEGINAKSIITSSSELVVKSGEFFNNEVINSVIYNKKNCSVSYTTFNYNSLDICSEDNLILNNIKIKTENTYSILNKGVLLLKNVSDEIKNLIDNKGLIKNDEIPKGAFDFSYLDKKIQECDGKLILNHDINLENYELDYYEGGIELARDGLVIDGNGKSISGNNNSRIFIVTGKNITIKNVTFKEGYVQKNPFNLKMGGGCIRNNSKANLTLENCYFIYNMSETTGGAILNFGKLKLVNTTTEKNQFENNTAGMSGGAIFNMGELEINGIGFKNNSQTKTGKKLALLSEKSIEYGGAAITNLNKIKINECIFENNNANQEGGAIRSIGRLNINKSEFINNCSQSNGGAIACDKLNVLKVIGSIFKDNKSENGGAIYNALSYFDICTTQFLNNEAGTGGVIYSEASDKERLNINDCIFKNNKSLTSDVGVIWVYTWTPNITPIDLCLENSTFENNYPRDYELPKENDN